LVRKGLPVRGYPKQSPEQERIRGKDTRELELDDTDKSVYEVVNGLSRNPKRIVREYWLFGKSMQEIAWAEKLSKSGVKWRIDAVKDKVARHCLNNVN